MPVLEFRRVLFRSCERSGHDVRTRCSPVKAAVHEIPFARPEFDEAEAQAVAQVLSSGWVSQGPRVARFEEMQDLRDQLTEANTQLAERKVIERAKGLLMKSRNLDEQAAFATLRKAAMDRKLKLSEVAQRIVDAADLLGA